MRILQGVFIGLAILSLVGCGPYSSSPQTSGSIHSVKVSQTYTPPPSSSSSKGTPSGQGSTPSTVPGTGCTYGPFCITSGPSLHCGCSSITSWSNIYVGETVPIKGAVEVNATTKAPVYPDIAIEGPGGWTAKLPTGAGGTFSQDVTFPSEGWYEFGIPDGGQLADTSTRFFVPYLPHVLSGVTVPQLFPDGVSRLSDNVALAAPANGETTFQILFTDFGGNPVRDQTFGYAPMASISTDANGIATIPFSSSDPSGPGLDELYPGLWVLTYITDPVSNGQITSWPPIPQSFSGVPTTVDTVTENGTVDYNVGMAVSRLDPYNFQAWVSASPKDGSLTLSSMSAATVVLKPNGQLIGSTCNPDCHLSQTPEAQVFPVISDGQIYLDLPDLVTVLNSFAWAAIAPDGTLLFADFMIP